LNITVNVIKAFSDGNQVSVTLSHGSTAGAAGSRVGAPSGSVYRVNGMQANTETPLGDGDILTVSLGKVDVG